MAQYTFKLRSPLVSAALLLPTFAKACITGRGGGAGAPVIQEPWKHTVQHAHSNTTTATWVTHRESEADQHAGVVRGALACVRIARRTGRLRMKIALQVHVVPIVIGVLSEHHHHLVRATFAANSLRRQNQNLT